MNFEELSMSKPLQKAIDKKGFVHLTPVQEAAIPPALDGKDVLATAQTGTGKTVAFLLPSMDHLLQRGGGKNPRMVILAPTRELVVQITEEARSLGLYASLRIAAIYGGVSIKKQAEKLRRGVDIVVATPGRLMDHMRRKNVRFRDLEILVLDEADRMLDMGFLPDIDLIVDHMPIERQTLLFSATMPPEIQSLSYRFMISPERIEIATARPPETIQQALYPVHKHLKTDLLLELLRQEEVKSAIVFTRTKQEADVLTRKLGDQGFTVAVIHGDFHQRMRTKALNRFRTGAVRILIATDVASRGLDIEGVSHVINYDAPEEAENYVHRIGRTARVENTGVAWTLITPEDEPLVNRIEYLLGDRLERVRHPSFDYNVPVPDWARPSAKTILRNAEVKRSSIDRWKALTR